MARAGEHDHPHVVVVVQLREGLPNGSITSKAIEFIRSGRFRTTSAMCGLGRSTRTKPD